MKIAVIISGEYRTFSVARKSMKFLDNPNVDIYFSTWDRSLFYNKRARLQVSDPVTESQIRSVIGRDATMIVEPSNLITERKYNTKMIYRWLRGFELVEQSGKEYDFVIVTRPDIIFDNTHPCNLDNILEYKNLLGMGWFSQTWVGKLSDIIFIASFRNMKLLMNALTIDDWISSPEHDWHIWWYNHVMKFFSVADIRPFESVNHFTFCRFWVKPEHTFIEAYNIQLDWRDLILLGQLDEWGRDKAIIAWPDQILPAAEEKWNSGYFNKYIA